MVTSRALDRGHSLKLWHTVDGFIALIVVTLNKFSMTS
jgi:hypothetical protein